MCLFVIALSAGCAPKIGDHCSISTDCSANGDRLCDTTQPGGYCTIFNCEPNGCPEEAVCVAFNEKSCPDLGNGQSTAQAVRFQRTFCMATCSSNGDCRGGYICLDTSHDPARKVVDQNPSSLRICTVAPAVTLPEASPPPDAPPPAVCLPTDASFASSDAGAEANLSSADVSMETASDVTSGPDGSSEAADDGSDGVAPDAVDDGSAAPEAGD